MDKKIILSTLVLCGLTLAGCTKKEPAETSTEATSSTAKTENIQVNDTKPTETQATSQTTFTPTYIETKAGANASTVHLVSAKVVGQILSVELNVEPPKPNQSYDVLSIEIPLDQVSYIDDATSKKVGLLKDDAGMWMVSHQINPEYPNRLKDTLYKPFPLNFKFPAPSAEAKTVSINITNLASFDGVPISR